MQRITASTIEGQTIDLCYDPHAAEGQRYAVDGRPVLQGPRQAGEVWEFWVPRSPPGPPYDIYRIAETELQRLREALAVPDAGTRRGTAR